MKRAMYLALALLAAWPLLLQAQLQQPPAPTATRPVTLPPPSQPPSTSPRLPQDVRPPSVKPPKPVPKVKPIVQPAQSVRPIYDSKGQPAPHMRQTSPGRVLDTRTNRYYDTVPSGMGQQVVPPPAGTR